MGENSKTDIFIGFDHREELVKYMYRYLLNKIIRSKSFYVFIFLVALFSYRLVNRVSVQNEAQVLLTIFSNIINKNLLLFLVVPIFLLQNGIITEFFDRSTIVLKNSNCSDWWNKKFFAVCMLSGIFTIINYIFVLFTIYLSGHLEKLDINFVSFFLPEYSVFFSIMYLLAISIALVTLGAYRIKNMDII